MLKRENSIETPIKDNMAGDILSNPLIGWVAITIGVFVILAVLFLILMATVNPLFGKVNDVFNGLIGLSSAVLAWMLYAEHHAKAPMMSQIGLAMAIIGAIFTVIGSILIIYGYTDFVLAGWYTGLGNALIGMWLLAFCDSMKSSGTLPQNLMNFGLVAGMFMVVGLIGIFGIFTRNDSWESIPWYLYIAYIGYLGTYILYPIWTIWFGRNLLLK